MWKCRDLRSLHTGTDFKSISSCSKIVNNPKILLTAKFPYDHLLDKLSLSTLWGTYVITTTLLGNTLPSVISLATVLEFYHWFPINMDHLTIILFFHHSPLICLNALDSSARDDNNAANVTPQREAARTLTPKDLSGSFRLAAEVTEIFQNMIWKASCWKSSTSSWWQYWWPCSCHSILHAIHTVHLYLNCVNLFLPASFFITFILMRKNPSLCVSLLSHCSGTWPLKIVGYWCTCLILLPLNSSLQ